jgi:hypothetical protein
VALGFYVLNIGKINQTDETFDISGLVTTTWVDKRLAFQPSDVGDQVMRYTADEIWVPELTIINAANLQRTSLIQLSVKPDGSVKMVEFVAVTVSSDFNLRMFPFDTQTALVIWEPLSMEVQPVELVNDARSEGFSKDSYVTLSEWDIEDFHSSVTQRKAEKDGFSLPRHTFSLHIKRNYAFYLFKVALPLLLITVISWTAFWLNPTTSFVPQLNLGITSILAAITFNITVTSSLPRVPYITLMDGFIAICYTFFFVAILGTVTLYYLVNIQKAEQAQRLIRHFRWAVPLAFAIAQGASAASFLMS